MGKDYASYNNELISSENVKEAESKFYSSYRWCLNPLLSFKELIQHYAEELNNYDKLKYDWQFEESRINLYLFVCAVACTVDDYIAWIPWNIIYLSNYYPRLKIIIRLLHHLLNFPYTYYSYFKKRKVNRWRNKWSDHVDYVCRLLIENSGVSYDKIIHLITEFDMLKRFNFPEDLLNRRMLINEGFRCQDLTHHDIISLAELFLESVQDRKQAFTVLGPRTAGAYFAPLVKTYLEMKGIDKVSWLTIRPRNDLSGWEKRRLRKLSDSETRVILTDDYPNTGKSFRLLQETVKKFKVSSKNIIILAPIHASKTKVNLSAYEDTKIIKLYSEDLYKKKLLESAQIEILLTDYLFSRGITSAALTVDSFVEEKNLKLNKQYKYSFQVRLKRLYEFINNNNESLNFSAPKELPGSGMASCRILAKSVGWAITPFLSETI